MEQKVSSRHNQNLKQHSNAKMSKISTQMLELHENILNALVIYKINSCFKKCTGNAYQFMQKYSSQILWPLVDIGDKFSS